MGAREREHEVLLPLWFDGLRRGPFLHRLRARGVTGGPPLSRIEHQAPSYVHEECLGASKLAHSK